MMSGLRSRRFATPHGHCRDNPSNTHPGGTRFPAWCCCSTAAAGSCDANRSLRGLRRNAVPSTAGCVAVPGARGSATASMPSALGRRPCAATAGLPAPARVPAAAAAPAGSIALGGWSDAERGHWVCLRRRRAGRAATSAAFAAQTQAGPVPPARRQRAGADRLLPRGRLPLPVRQQALYARTFGYDEESIIGMSFAQVIGEAAAAEIQPMVDQVLSVAPGGGVRAQAAGRIGRRRTLDRGAPAAPHGRRWAT